jgi:hypothetical protein
MIRFAIGLIVPLVASLAVSSTSRAQTATTADSAAATDTADDATPPTQPDWAIAVHGGAGSISEAMTPQREAVYHAVLRRALAAGSLVLADGGSAVDAVEEAVRCLEDDPLFNAGRGAVATIEGTFELDASIMDGNGMRAGGVAGIRVASNPISVARRVMDTTGHVLLGGPQADEFAIHQLVEVAGRAMSTGLNDTFTAITAADHLGAAYARIGGRGLPNNVFRDEEGEIRLLLPLVTFGDVFAAGMNQLRQHARTTPAVSIRLLDMLVRLLPHLQRAEDRQVVAAHARAIAAGAEEAAFEPLDQHAIRQRLALFEEDLSRLAQSVPDA